MKPTIVLVDGAFAESSSWNDLSSSQTAPRTAGSLLELTLEAATVEAYANR